ncbi:hypothetical protein DVDV_4280 [Desulfovibrio sp. DV]|uniref:hypothetical protein n=1 Tax=Desulfovibrio sp. DV TaxID=1844708 RepID=UPI0009598E6A|nr:hypothetical protein [Desulfovibrio sp. DV]OLN24389.1 hypothetical protein DVDV_4280 [Desulfovibrio sp. DV]
MTPRRALLAGLLLALLTLLAALAPPIADDDVSWTLVLDALHKQDLHRPGPA